ncbi:MAG: hypothetical protein ABII89_07010 [Candidatus Omnitrophota bacterium]
MTITESQELLLKAVKANRLAAAYLFIGAGEAERRALAKFLTQALFCSEITPGSLPCNHCSACRRVAEEKHPDLFLIRGEGVMGFLSIDQVRQLKSEIYLSPYQAKYRVYLLEIEAIRDEAANAFLKTLEEPPETAIIIILSQTEREFIPTILSRLAKIRLPEPELSVSNLQHLTSTAGLSWQEPSGIFKLAKEMADAEEEDLKLLLKEIIAGLRISLEFKEGLRSREETPEAMVKIANKAKDAGELRSLLEKALGRRQDILRGRVTTRLALETLLIPLSQPAHPIPPPERGSQHQKIPPP